MGLSTLTQTRMRRLLSRLIDPHGAPSAPHLRTAVQGKVVLITGASYGIGEATAQALAEAGAIVLLVARSADKLLAVAASIQARGGTAYAYPTDLADAKSVAELVRQVLEQHGHVDVLVNNAGKSIRRSIALSYDRFHDFQRTIDVNYLGPVQLTLALLQIMRAQKRGHIVNVSTIGTRVPPAPRWAAYQASKTAFDVFLRSVALEARADGVTTTSIYMALVYTRMSAPTPIFRKLPGLTPEEAAQLVARAIVDKPRSIAPWWLSPAELAADAARGPLEIAMGALYRYTRDTSSARRNTH